MIGRVLAVSLTLLSLAACEDGRPTPEPPRTLDDLCDAVGSTVDEARQEAAFFDRAHDALHSLAERVTKENPEVAGELLEAKQRVEANLRRTKKAVPTEVFEDLIDAADRALAEVDAPKIRCGS